MTNHQDKELSGEHVERVAEAIYAKFQYHGPGDKPKWVDGGNSFRQDDARAALAASPQLPVAEQPAGQAVSDAPIRSAICSAITSFGHEMSASKIVLHRDNVAGGNLLTQIVDRVVSALAAAPHSPVAQMSGDGLLREALAALKTWADVAPAVSLVADIEKYFASHPSNAVQDARDIPTDTGNPEADRIIRRLASSDPDFDDCTAAAAFIYKLVAEHRGPEGFATWKDAAFAERMKRVELEQAATVPQVVQAPVETHLRSRIADLLHLLEFAKIETPSEGDAQQAIKAMTDIQTILHSAPQPVAASPSIVPIGQLALTAARKIRESIDAGDQSGMTIQRIIDDVFTTASNAGEAKQGGKS